MTTENKPYKVLVIEDNPGDFTIISEYLCEEMVTPVIHQVTTCEDARLLLGGIKMYFDVILLDLTLPDSSGEELISEIVKLSLDCPVIVLTGYSNIAFSIKSLSLGVSDYILKDELSSAALYKNILYSIERKKKLSLLEDSEKKYSDLFNLSPQPILVFELETLHFTDVNNAAISYYGYSREEFFRMAFSEILPKEDIHTMEDKIFNPPQLDEPFFHGTIRHIKKNGDVVYAEMYSNVILAKGKSSWLALINDVTERVRQAGAIELRNIRQREIALAQSDTMRTSLAKMMGILNHIRNLKIATPECTVLLNYLSESGTELDTVIKGIVIKTEHAFVA